MFFISTTNSEVVATRVANKLIAFANSPGPAQCKNELPASTPPLNQKGGAANSKKVPDKSSTYEQRKYLVPSSLLASQTTKAPAKARKRAMQLELLTYSKLLEDQSLLVPLGQLNPQTAANRATALRLFLRANHIHETDVVGSEMRLDFPASINRMNVVLREQGRSDRSISNVRSAVTPWKQAVVADDTFRARESNKLTPFNTELTRVLDCHPIKVVARQAGVPQDMLYGWLNGKSPRASSAKFIRRIESFFGLDREGLVSLAGISGSSRPKDQVGDAEKIDYRKALGLRTQNRYCLVAPADSPLREQWSELLRYKTAPVPLLNRGPAGRWTFTALNVMRSTDANWMVFLDGIEIPTAKATWSLTASYLGWLALNRDAGGPGEASETLETLAWLCIPDHIENYLAWTKQRSGGRVTQSALVFLGIVTWMSRPGNGYLYQQPEFLKTLPARFKNENWHDLCTRQHAYCAKLHQALVPEVESSRDPFEPIQHIIELAEPLEAVADMVQRMRRDRPVGCAIREAVWARDIFMVKLFVSNPLRLRNMATLTWTPDNKSGLYQRSDGSWWIRIPRRHFKNRRGVVCAREYDSPIHSSVWADLERYLLRHRQTLLRWPTEFVFVAKTRDPVNSVISKNKAFSNPPQSAHRPFMEMNRHIFQLTRRYLWKCDGIGTHAFRHIVATAILKSDAGDIKTAALVLHDRESTVEKHYSGLRSGDGSVRMGELLAKSLNRM